MSLLYLIFLAIIQGITEFLPISSSAHLILPAQLFESLHLVDQGPLIDLMAHFGSLGAVVLYYRADMRKLWRGGLDIASLSTTRRQSEDARLFLYLSIASLPALSLGVVLSQIEGAHLRSPWVIAYAMIGFAFILWASDVIGKRKIQPAFSPALALWIGAAQMLAFIPGTSRAGITMSAARMAGFGRAQAARFSILMAVPILLAAGVLAFIQLWQTTLEEAHNTPKIIGAYDAWQAGLIVCGLSFVSSYIAVNLFMRFIEKIGFLPFVIYRVLLGSALLVILLA